MTEQEKIQKFINYSRTGELYARELLSQFNWDYDKAVDWYWRNVVLESDIDND